MLQRVLEPEVMDTPEEARDYNNMDHSRVNIAFVDDLLRAGFTGGDVLDLGTGTALIPIEIVKRGLECRIMAADAAIAMLERARLNLEIAGMTRVIQLSHCDAKGMPYASGMFDCGRRRKRNCSCWSTLMPLTATNTNAKCLMILCMPPCR
jgi:SAM-dependent methyltransferase